MLIDGEIEQKYDLIRITKELKNKYKDGEIELKNVLTTIITVGIKKSWKTERKVRVNQDHKGRVESQSGFVSKWRRLTSSQFCHFTILPFCHFAILLFCRLLFFLAFYCFAIFLWSLQIYQSLTSRCLNVPVKLFLFLLSPQISVFVSKIPPCLIHKEGSYR